MSRLDSRSRLVPSLLDRLIDPDSEGTNFQRGYSVQQMLAAVKRDLEELLNSHQTNQDIPPEWEQLNNSLLTYGIPDLMSISIGAASDKEKVAQAIEQVVARCEPRLRDVRVDVASTAEDDMRSLKFNIDARLNVDPSPDVAFITVVDLMTGKTSIQQRET
jgi:type VI secretion system protein ImpF